MDSEDEGGAIRKAFKQKKSPFQKRGLLKAYAENKYPTDQARAKLADELDLTDKQLQMWFCHERRKEKIAEKAKQTKSTRSPPGSPGDIPLGADAYEIAVEISKRKRNEGKSSENEDEPDLDRTMSAEGFFAAALANEVEDSALLAGKRHGVDKETTPVGRSKKQQEVQGSVLPEHARFHAHDSKMRNYGGNEWAALPKVKPRKYSPLQNTEIAGLKQERETEAELLNAMESKSTVNGTNVEESEKPYPTSLKESRPGNKSSTQASFARFPNRALDEGQGFRPGSAPAGAKPTVRIKMPGGVGPSARMKLPKLRPPTPDSRPSEAVKAEGPDGVTNGKREAEEPGAPPGHPLGRPLRRSEMAPPMRRKKKTDRPPSNLSDPTNHTEHEEENITQHPRANDRPAKPVAENPIPRSPLGPPSGSTSPLNYSAPHSPYLLPHGIPPMTSARHYPATYPGSSEWDGRAQVYGLGGGESLDEVDEDLEVQEAMQMERVARARAASAAAEIEALQASLNTMQARRRAAAKMKARQVVADVEHG